ncbi:hypothetical protein BZA05DRAFT_405139 [Tricharina praecox]|uniref:uncharacterized protein n=1 Tax=Tricharina praecox TaxID=43433 RepID=UPI002220C943|nr:uncharacterized protein BZA05DRAFT_405139 [Tricharina praecox]KAI5847533.1 hypothetical protein BZA05DRAFT_405139 [Tricharina praecox]
MPWEAGKLLYCIEWKPHDVDVAPLFWWVKLSGMQFHSALVNEYHHRHALDPPRWPNKRRVRSSASLGVREIKRALEERRLHLTLHGVAEEDTARELADERWRIRDEWQHTGRGWGCAKEIVQRRRKEWMEAEHEAKTPCDNEEEVDQPTETEARMPLGLVKQHSEPILRSRQRFDAQDELEWREHFGGIISAAGPKGGSVVSLQQQLLPRGSCANQPLSKVVSTLVRTHKRPPLYAALVGRGGGSGGGSASTLLLFNGAPSVDSSKSLGSSGGKGIFASLLDALNWSLWGRRQEAGTASDATCVTQGLSTAGESPAVGDLDGAPRSESGQQTEGFSGSSPIDMTAPFEVTRSQTPKQIDSLYSFPGYEVFGSRSLSTPSFQYKPSPSVSVEKVPLRTQTPNQQQPSDPSAHQHHHHHHNHHHHHHKHHHNKHQQPTSKKSKEPLAGLDVQKEEAVQRKVAVRKEPLEVHESELWLDGVGSPYPRPDSRVLIRRNHLRQKCVG